MNILKYLLSILILVTFGFLPKSYGLTSVGGTLLDDIDTVCYGNNYGMLRLNGEIGDVQYWEYSTSGSSPWITINHTIDSLEYNDLTQTTYFRVIVKYGTTPQDTSSVAVVYVSPLSDAGTLSQDMEVCASSNTGTLQLSGYTGHSDHWEYSSDNGVSWNIINDTTDTYTFNNLSVTNQFRVIVKSGVCSTDTSNRVTVAVYPTTNAGILAANDTVCYGNNSGEIILSGYTGDIVRWETSPTGYTPWATVNFTNDTLSFTNSVNTNYYRAVVQSGVCNESNSNAVSIVVSPPSEGGIVSGSQEVCSGANSGTLVLSDYTGNILNWQYSTDYGTTWTDTANINHTLSYSQLTQTTQFRAVVQSGACDSAFSEISTITVNPLPVVSFSFDTVCRTQATGFINNTTILLGQVVSYSWDFGNGDGNNAETPVYTYPVEGTYTVKLTATSDKGCIDSTTNVIKVNPTPVVDYSFTNVCDRDSATFQNTSFSTIGGNISYEWSFGDSSSVSTDENPAHRYAQSGNYNVKLIVKEDSTGCEDSLIQSIDIYPRAVPEFVFTNVCDGNEMNFTNTTTISSGNVNYYWTFGDGYYDNVINSNHLYGGYGSYSVRLSATTDNNCTDTVSHLVNVFPQPSAMFSGADICYTDTFHFINNSVIGAGNMTYLWNFGNGDTSISENPDYYYFAPGTYAVSLSVESDSGCTDQYNKNITVYSLPNVAFDVNNVCRYDSAAFINNSSIQSGNLTYLWHFGNNSSSTMRNPKNLYDTAGTYDVELITTSGGMCSDSLTKPLIIFPVPQPDFDAENICDGELASFYNQTTIASGNIANILWDFGDGTNSVQENPTQQYLNPGTYNVALSVTSNNGCTADTTKPLTVDYMPVANFTVYNVCDNEPINPSNLSTIEQGSMTYQWDFGDDDSSIVPEPNHVYNSSGIYRINLTVQSEHGCVDSLIRYVQIYPLPNVYAGQDTSISKGNSILLNASGGNIYTWFPSTSLSNPTIPNPTASPTVTTNYVAQVEDLNGCVNYDTLKITVIDDYKISPNNIITPNGDGINDTWIINNIENYNQSTVFIYDRWGNEVYNKTAYDNSWNGTNSNGDLLPDGTYYYVIKFSGSDVAYKGAVSILRNH